MRSDAQLASEGYSGQAMILNGACSPCWGAIQRPPSTCSQGLQYIVANVSDPATLRAMAAQTQVIISTAGPFAKFGTPVVEAALEEGTHYCDITGGCGWQICLSRGRGYMARVCGNPTPSGS
jgi:hypothetical protein